MATANDGIEALSLFSGQRYDLIILDILLPKIDGYGVCELIRKQSDVPIIMLTALSGEEDQIRGLDLQVDDYITKPFSMPILLRKIAAVLRRSKRGEDEKPQIITYGNLLLNCDSYAATVDGSDFELTQKEFEILRELLTHQGRILTRQNLLDKLWRFDFYGDERVVDTHIKNLRKKLGIDFIQTIRGWDIKLIKKIKGSLFIKVFITTAILLTGVSFLVYLILAWYTPKTYSNTLNATLDEQTKIFISEISQMPMEETGGIFDNFLDYQNVDRMELFEENGNRINLPTERSADNDVVIETKAWGNEDNNAPIISNSYTVSFLGKNTNYTLVVYGAAGQVAELQRAFQKVFPLLAFIVFCVSLVTGWIFHTLLLNPY